MIQKNHSIAYQYTGCNQKNHWLQPNCNQNATVGCNQKNLRLQPNKFWSSLKKTRFKIYNHTKCLNHFLKNQYSFIPVLNFYFYLYLQILNLIFHFKIVSPAIMIFLYYLLQNNGINSTIIYPNTFKRTIPKQAILVLSCVLSRILIAIYSTRSIPLAVPKTTAVTLP